MTLTILSGVALGIIFEGILYGAYVVLFALYLVLWRRSHRVVNEPLALAQILLFGLCTLRFCFDISVEYFQQVMEDASAFKHVNTGSEVIFAIIDYLAQIILLYRCWIVWGRRWVVIAIPGFLALVSLGGGFAFTAFSNSPLWSTDHKKVFHLLLSAGIVANSVSLIANALATSLIVAKILTSQEANPVLDSNSRRSLRIVVAMLIESGLLMFTFQLVFLILFSIQHPACGLIAGPISQIYGITPTLLNIRVIMHSTNDETTEEAPPLKFAHPPGEATSSNNERATDAAT